MFDELIRTPCAIPQLQNQVRETFQRRRERFLNMRNAARIAFSAASPPAGGWSLPCAAKGMKTQPDCRRNSCHNRLVVSSVDVMKIAETSCLFQKID